MDSRKVVTIVFFILILGVGYYSMNAAPVQSDHQFTYQGGVEWYENPDDAAATASAENKPILVYYWTTWCTYCDDYDEDHYRDPEVRDLMDDYVLLAINLDDPGPGEPLANAHNANYPPQHVIMTPDGEPIEEIGGFVEQERFVEVLEQSREDLRL